MFSLCPSQAPCNLLANFLTHSYLNLLDQYLLYTKHSSKISNIQALLQATQSFLFMFNKNPDGLSFLDISIFSHYLSYDELFSINRRKVVHLSKIRRNYSHALLKSSSHDTLLDSNATFIQRYYTTLFSSFDTLQEVPLLFTLSTAESFISEVKNIRHSLLKNSPY